MCLKNGAVLMMLVYVVTASASAIWAAVRISRSVLVSPPFLGFPCPFLPWANAAAGPKGSETGRPGTRNRRTLEKAFAGGGSCPWIRDRLLLCLTVQRIVVVVVHCLSPIDRKSTRLNSSHLV